MRGIFVTGTDTGVGKTVITGLLAKYLRKAGYNVITQKWIQTGCRNFSGSDMATHMQLMGRSAKGAQKYQRYMLPNIFKFPASPHLAAQLEKRRIVHCKIKRYYARLAKEFDLVLVEGVGGTLVPFDRKNLVIDIAKELNLPVLVVAQNKLGSINHTLLTIEALRTRKFKILGVIFNNAGKEDKRILEDNPEIIKALTGEKILGILPREKSRENLYAKFLPIGKKLKKELKI